jgi:hypothetical protein
VGGQPNKGRPATGRNVDRASNLRIPSGARRLQRKVAVDEAEDTETDQPQRKEHAVELHHDAIGAMRASVSCNDS